MLTDDDSTNSGSILTVDINEGGITILSTELTIDNHQKDIDSNLLLIINQLSNQYDAEITIDIDQLAMAQQKA